MEHDLRRWMRLVESESQSLPSRHFEVLFHVGTMNPRRKYNIGFEGAGLSVSLHPTIWRNIAKGWIHGDLWRLTRTDNRFLDFKALSSETYQTILQWGKDQGYITLSTTPAGSKYPPPGTVTAHATNKLLSRTGQTDIPGMAVTLLLTVFVEDETDYDGIWWDEPLNKRVGGIASRGTIFASRLAAWTIETVQQSEAPDKDAFKRIRKPKPISDVTPP